MRIPGVVVDGSGEGNAGVPSIVMGMVFMGRAGASEDVHNFLQCLQALGLDDAHAIVGSERHCNGGESV